MKPVKRKGADRKAARKDERSLNRYDRATKRARKSYNKMTPGAKAEYARQEKAFADAESRKSKPRTRVDSKGKMRRL
jgi:hypothetical protein